MAELPFVGPLAEQVAVYFQPAIDEAVLAAMPLKANATIIGVDGSDSDMGSYAGYTVASGGSAKDNIQDLESALETIAQPSTGRFYAENGARVQRFRDRGFFGAAADNNGTNVGVQPDWLTTYLISKGRTFGFQHVTQVAALTQERGSDTANFIASNGFLAGAKTSTINGVGNAIGVLGVGVNDNTTYATGAWGGYFEGFQNAGATGPAYAAEFDVINFGTTGSISPYAQAGNQVVALQVASGAEFTGAGNAHAVMNVRNNGARFQTGIVFGDTSLVGTDGTGTGTAIAVAMARGHGLQWRASNSIITTQIFCVASTAAAAASITFSDNATSFSNASTGKNLLSILNAGATVVNGVQVQSSATGAPVGFLAAGDDANIDIRLVPKGTGLPRFGTWSASADAAVNGYITVKDDTTGTTRKLATIA